MRFSGPRYVHAAVLQQFTTDAPPPAVRLAARARQFSSFILMLGTLAPGNAFEPKHGLIIKDKDQVVIPLLTNTIPSPKEFKRQVMQTCRTAHHSPGFRMACTPPCATPTHSLPPASGGIFVAGATSLCKSLPRNAACWHPVHCRDSAD